MHVALVLAHDGPGIFTEAPRLGIDRHSFVELAPRRHRNTRPFDRFQVNEQARFPFQVGQDVVRLATNSRDKLAEVVVMEVLRLKERLRGFRVWSFAKPR